MNIINKKKEVQEVISKTLKNGTGIIILDTKSEKSQSLVIGSSGNGNTVDLKKVNPVIEKAKTS